MKLSRPAAYDAAMNDCVQFAATSGHPAAPLGEAFTNAGISLLIHEMGAPAAALYVVTALRVAVDEEVASDGN